MLAYCKIHYLILFLIDSLHVQEFVEFVPPQTCGFFFFYTGYQTFLSKIPFCPLWDLGHRSRCDKQKQLMIKPRKGSALDSLPGCYSSGHFVTSDNFSFV